MSALWHMRLRNHNIETEKSEQTEYLSLWICKLAIMLIFIHVNWYSFRQSADYDFAAFICFFLFLWGGGAGEEGFTGRREESTLWHMWWRKFLILRQRNLSKQVLLSFLSLNMKIFTVCALKRFKDCYSKLDQT